MSAWFEAEAEAAVLPLGHPYPVPPALTALTLVGYPQRDPGKNWDHPLPLRQPTFTPNDPAALALLDRVANRLWQADGDRGPRIPGAALAAATEPEIPDALDFLDAMPGYGRIRILLTRMAATSAERAEPIFRDTCADCHAAAGGWCRHHEAMREESAQFRKLALALGSAATDHDAWLLTAAAAAAIEGGK